MAGEVVGVLAACSVCKSLAGQPIHGVECSIFPLEIRAFAADNPKARFQEKPFPNMALLLTIV